MNVDAGEREHVLGGKKYLLRPTFDALQEIETLTDKGLYEIFLSYTNSGRIGFISSVLYACIKGGWPPKSSEGPPSLQEVGAVVLKEGLKKHFDVTYRIVLWALTQGQEANVEKKTETQMNVAEKPSGESSTAQP